MAFWRFKWQTFELGGFAPRLLRADSASAAPTPGDGAPPPADHSHSGGDKILLPSEVLEAVMGASPEETESPLTFSLTCGSTRAFCGVIEFTSPTGTVTLPPAVVDALGLHLTDQLDDTKLISVRRVQLPRATAVRLQPLDASFWGIVDFQSALEFALRSRFTVLSPFQVISLRYAGRTYQILVLEVEPDGPGVLIVNTDCVVNIEPPLGGGDAAQVSVAGPSVGAASGGGRPSPLVLGSSVSGTVLLGQPCVFTVLVPDVAALEASDLLVEVTGPAGAAAPRPVGATLSGAPAESVEAPAPAIGEPDLYVDVAPNRSPSLLEHRWSWNGAGSNGSVRVADSAPPVADAASAEGSTTVLAAMAAAASAAPQSRTYYVSVVAYGGTAEFVLSASLVPKVSGAAAVALAAAPAAVAGPSEAICPSCGAVVPAARLDLHAAVCARNNIRCPAAGCGAVLRRGPAAFRDHWHCPECALVMREAEGAKHAAIAHVDHACPHGCGNAMRLEPLREHAKNSCRLRLVTCRFCGASVRAGNPPADFGDRQKGLTEHESYCGARTAACGLCRQPLLLKDNDAHFRLTHPGVEVVEPSQDLVPKRVADRVERSRAGDGGGDGDDDMDRVADDGASAGPWTCSACTFANASERSSCEMCGGQRPERKAARPAPPRRTAPAPRCHNATCNQLAATSGAAGELELCSRCFGQFAAESPDQDELVSSLSRRYALQLTAGCGQRGCTNPYCATARAAAATLPASGAATGTSGPPPAPPVLTRQGSSTSGDLAKLLGLASQPSHRAQYFVCIPVVPPPPVPSAAAPASDGAGRSGLPSLAARRGSGAASRIARADF